MTGTAAKEIVRLRLIQLKAARAKFPPHVPPARTLHTQIGEAAEILSLLEKCERQGSIMVGGITVLGDNP